MHILDSSHYGRSYRRVESQDRARRFAGMTFGRRVLGDAVMCCVGWLPGRRHYILRQHLLR
jgi:hypothetical protein